MTERIGRLCRSARRLLRLAACIGNQFDLETLAVVSGGLPRETAAALAEPLAREVIAPIGESYKDAAWSEATPDAAITYRFEHDRLQQAAYDADRAG